MKIQRYDCLRTCPRGMEEVWLGKYCLHSDIEPLLREREDIAENLGRVVNNPFNPVATKYVIRCILDRITGEVER